MSGMQPHRKWTDSCHEVQVLHTMKCLCTVCGFPVCTVYVRHMGSRVNCSKRELKRSVDEHLLVPASQL